MEKMKGEDRGIEEIRLEIHGGFPHVPGPITRSAYKTFNQTVVSADILDVDKQHCVSEPTLKISGNTIIMTATFQAQWDVRYYARIKVLVTLGSRGEEGKPEIDTREVTFTMGGDDPTNIPNQIKEIDGKVIDCYLLDVEGHKGAEFSVKEIDNRAVECFGGFVADPDSKEPLEAKVKALVVVEKS